MNWEGNALVHTDVRKKAFAINDLRRMSPDRSVSRNAGVTNSESQVFATSPKKDASALNLRAVDQIAGQKVVLGVLEDEEIVNQEYGFDKIVKDNEPAVKMQTERKVLLDNSI